MAGPHVDGFRAGSIPFTEVRKENNVKKENMNLNENPLLVETGFPLFDRVTPEHVVPAMRHVLDGHKYKAASCHITSAPASPAQR
jgi:hypothetical protein